MWLILLCFLCLRLSAQTHFVFSGCPSVRQYVRPSVHPSEGWNTLFWPVHGSVGPPDQLWPFYGMSVRPSVCPSVRPERFPGMCRRTHGGNSLKFYMLIYLDHLQNWLVYGHGLFIFSCDQAALQMVFSVCPSVSPSVRHTFLTMGPSSDHHDIFMSYYQWPT